MVAGLVLSTKYPLFSSDTLEEKAGCHNCTSESWATSEEVQEQQDQKTRIISRTELRSPIEEEEDVIQGKKPEIPLSECACLQFKSYCSVKTAKMDTKGRCHGVCIFRMFVSS